MRHFNFSTFIVYLIIGLWVQVPSLACEQPQGIKDYSKLPLQLHHPFNPNDYQRLKGESRHEEDVLRYLRQLEVRFKQLPNPKMAFTDPEFLRARDQLANCFLKIFSYSAYLPGGGIMSRILGVTHVNSLEKVINQPIVKHAIDGIYYHRPIFKYVVDHVFNEELTRDDFNCRVRIGKNPFFDPLCILLNCLYNGAGFEKVNDLLAVTRQTLEKRYIYFNYLRPLDVVISQVTEICDSNFPECEKTAQLSYNHLLEKENLAHEDDYLDESEYLDEDDYLYNVGVLDTESPLKEEQTDPTIDRYLSFYQEVVYLFKSLKDIIYQNIDYRYGLDNKNPSIKFSMDLINLRKSIPWTVLSVLGSAAHLAKENRQGDIQRMFIQAVPDLLLDFRKLKGNLAALEVSECATFLNQEARVVEKDDKYPHIELFTTWYLNFIGISMVKTHIMEVEHYANSFSKAEVIFEGCYRWQLEQMRAKLPFLQSKSRLFILYYLFVDGELSKNFIESLTNRVDAAWLSLFKSFKTLRDDIMHKVQGEGQQKFEERLSSLSPQEWDQLLESYISVFDIIDTLDKGFDLFTWDDLKQQDWGNRLPHLSSTEIERLKDLESNLQHLSTFITTGSWKDPEEILRRQHKELAEDFKKDLSEKYRKQFSPPIDFLSRDQKSWDGTFRGFGKNVSKDNEMKEKWCQMRNCADKLKALKDRKKTNKGENFSLEKLKDNLQNLQWVLAQLDELYDYGRFSSIPEARIAELYLILLRENANNIVYNLSDYLVFDSNDQETLQFFNACTYVSAALPHLASSFGNHKAHIHRLTEVSSYELHFQTMGNMLKKDLKDLDKNIKIILLFLNKPNRFTETVGRKPREVTFSADNATIQQGNTGDITEVKSLNPRPVTSRQTQKSKRDKGKTKGARADTRVNMPDEVLPEVDVLQLSDFDNLTIQLMEDIEGLPIRSSPLNTKGQTQEDYTIDGKRFRRQNVSGTSMRCFFNAVGLEPDVEIGKLKSTHNDPIVRYMIANEIVSAAENPEQLPRQVKEAINYTLYEAQRGPVHRLEELRSDKLAAQSPDTNKQDTDALPEVLQTNGERSQHILEDLGKRSLALEAFNAFLNHHIRSKQMMVALHDVQGDGQGNINANYTSIDAVAYINNIGLKIYQPDGEGGLRAVHQFVPQGATEIVYLYHEGVHFQALVPFI